MIYLASKYADKGYDFETMYYCDDFFGKEQYAEQVWEYVEEYKEIGYSGFKQKYSQYKLYR